MVVTSTVEADTDAHHLHNAAIPTHNNLTSTTQMVQSLSTIQVSMLYIALADASLTSKVSYSLFHSEISAPIVTAHINGFIIDSQGVSRVILVRFSISQEDLFFLFIIVLLCYSPCAIVFDALCFIHGILVGKFTEEASQLVKFQSLLLPSSLFIGDARFHVVPSARVQFSMYHIEKAWDTASMFGNQVPKTCNVATMLMAVFAMLVYNHYLWNSSPVMSYLDDVNLTQIVDLSGIRSTSSKGRETTILPYTILPGQETFIVVSFQLLFSSWQANQDSLSSQSIKLYKLAVPRAERLLYHFSLANGVTAGLIDKVGCCLLLVISAGSMMALNDHAANSTHNTAVYVILTEVVRSETTDSV